MRRYLFILVVILYSALLKAEVLKVRLNSSLSSLHIAIKKSHAGDTIWVEAGSYKEPPLLIEHPLTIIGIDYPVIENTKREEIFTIESDSVNIIGLQLQNVDVNYVNDFAAIKVNKQEGCKFENNHILNSFFGIMLKNSSTCIIRNNYIKRNPTEEEDEMSTGNAIHLWYCRDMLIEKNETRNHRDGIYLEFVDRSIVRENLVVDNIRYGLHFMFSDHDQYIANTFRSNGAGVAVMFSKYIIMKNNHFEYNWGSSSYGLLLKDITDSEIIRNYFNTNTTGIYMEGSNRIKIFENIFNQNGWALKIYGSSNENQFSRNNFLNNSFELSVFGRSTTNKYDGNYWSLYTGYDLDKNGIGDVPYRPVKLFSRIIGKIPSSSILMRSLLIDIINFAEKVSPVLTPDYLMDHQPSKKPFVYD
ncbi:nitrous oxide reductase family maturation protein NosD [Ancylomarina longa]|uniref:Nitrous oxide reductase family maturation protein NosD n=1 Tax=Ancylomarina longa TaxID=2487017 RepID=A0A434AXT7_9BACT|nr:nitrous oxide reductase family maturation protein NosD [Ancylomarina longa]RUT79373.1 nitrous oxide reductase family maturation protein NosD [Ancylomarina longa]